MTEARHLPASRAGRTVYKAAPAQSVPMVWTPHGMIPLRARQEREVAQ